MNAQAKKPVTVKAKYSEEAEGSVVLYKAVGKQDAR
jgi:hypothetical protein